MQTLEVYERLNYRTKGIQMEMENDAMPGAGSAKDGPIKGQPKYKTMSSKKEGQGNFVRSITFSGDELTITGILNHTDSALTHYYDLKNIGFISNSGMARLILLLQSLLREGIDVKFINANEQIKMKVKEMGLEHILNCR